MKKIIVTSKNPIKVHATLNGFEKMFPGEHFTIESISVPSGVSAQPMSDIETLQGALNRVENAMRYIEGADYYVGVEGGIEEKNDEMEAFAWVVVKSKEGKIGKGKTGVFFLPQKIRALVNQGVSLGQADDAVFARSNSGHDSGAIGILTNNSIDRARFNTEAVVLALIPFVNSELY